MQTSWALCVKSEKANLRSGPGTKYDKTWEVYKYMPFDKVKRQGSWLKVRDVDGMDHWIFSKLVTTSYLCAVVKASKANLRTGPGVTYKKSPQWPTAPRYAAFRFLRSKGKWAQIQDSDGIKYWVSRSLIWVY